MATALTELLGSPVAIGAVTNGIETAIRHSFASHPMRHKTADEVKRRFEICVKWFRVFRTEKKFSIDRSVDQLGRALRAELDGVEYKPHERALWAPEAEPPRVWTPEGA